MCEASVRLTLLALALLAAACTGSPSGGPSATPTSPQPSPAASTSVPAIALQVVATTSGPQAEEDRGYLDGMQLAVQDENAAGGVDGRAIGLEVHDDAAAVGTATDLMEGLLSHHPAAILYVGPGKALSPLRANFEQTGTPVVLLEGDLYTSRGLFPQVFQTTIPWEWQAHVIARYVVVDRKAKDIVFIGEGPEAPAASKTLAAALAYWGGHLAASFDDRSLDPSTGLTPALKRAGRADWVVAFGPPIASLDLVNAIEEQAGIDRSTNPGARPGITGPASLLVSGGGLARPEPGTTACSTYTWAGWAQPIRRVGAFRAAFTRMTGAEPAGLEQEGYDAVRVLARALGKTGGAGGAKLVSAVEATQGLVLSGFPVDFGPDDHMFAPRDELGLFAVAGPKERLDPWEPPGTDPWRPVMRTFTYDGRRTNVLDMDRKVFFPFWGKDQPGPVYWRSRYGIVTRPNDPLH
jgi:ABC-type branched-subunit amino acid transport system substrate-binding protein